MSALYQAVALSLNKAGKIVTIEGAKTLAKYAEQNIETIGLENVRVVAGRFQDVLDEVLNESSPIDFAFIDGHHDEKAIMRYFEQIIPFLSNQPRVLVFDDIPWSPGMKRVWKKIKVDERVKISVDFRKVGICLMNKKIEE
ncbi:MAG TPA: class I SAM-dependent methyltransferase [Candidatus Marinimicrobia bacterium]|nr:class I SAM-dependent methyltransferase [Candidatus Neomarinimicrobiota bacterium]